MEGLILSLYLDKDMESVNARKDFKFLSWSPYDRISVKRVSRFFEFFQDQFQTKWVGVAQQMHLIHEFPEDFRWKFGEEVGRKDVLIDTEDAGEPYGLCAVVMVGFGKGVSAQKGYREEIYRQLELKKNIIEEIEWNAFYSLGAEDIVFIVLANSVSKIHGFVEKLNTLSIEGDLFCRISSFVNMNRENWFERMDASLMVRLNLKSGKKEDVQSAIKVLCNNGIPDTNIQQLLLGKCVLDVRIPEEQVDLHWFSDGSRGIFNGEHPFYKQYISSSRSYWYFEWANDFEFTGQIAEKEMDSEGRDFHNEEDHDIEELMELCSKIPMAQFVIKEYQRLIHSNQSGWWSDVLEKQFDSVKIFMREYVKNENRELLNSLLRQLQNVLLHIRQSTISTTEVPYLNYIYAGSYNDIMKMYYGIISELFEIGFEMEHDVKGCQYELAFCVDFESAAHVHSDMYPLPQSAAKKRFVVFHLPFDAFTDIEGTAQCLCHEVFHYIAPYSRKERNRILLDIWCKNQIQRMVEFLMNKFEFSDEIRYLLGQRYVVGSDGYILKLLDRIYEKTKLKFADYDEWIINNFWGESQISFRKIYNIIVEEMLSDLVDTQPKVVDWVYADAVISEKEKHKGGEKEKKKSVEGILIRMLESDSQHYFTATEIRNISHAYREAFSDLNMVYLFGLDVAGYLKMFYKLEVERNVSPMTEEMFHESLNEDFILRSYERRLGMTLYEISKSEDMEMKEIFSELRRKSTENTYIDFIDYVEKIYDIFMENDKLILPHYQLLFEEVRMFWIDAISDKIKEKKSEFAKILGCGDDLEKNILVLRDFSAKNIVFKRSGKCDSEKYLQRNLIADAREITYGEVQVESLGQFFELAYRLSKQLIAFSKEVNQPCWYRGICDRDFSLLPSLYRLYNDKEKEQIRHSIYAYQTKILQDAYYLTMKMSDLWTEQLSGIAEHTSCLQHYGMPTTLLDFSLDMLVALYFALNPDKEEDRGNIDTGKYTPKVVVFNPVLYNKALWSLRAGKVIDDEPYIRCSPVMFDSGDREMQDYFVSDMSVEKSVESTKKFLEKTYVPDPRIDLYPKPIIIQQTNSRVLSQNGIFMAYNLNALPDQWEKPFKYLDLKEIQEKYMDLFENENNKKKAYFLREIIIAPSAADKIRKQLNMLGMNKAKMYPELSEIFKEYSQ